MSLPVGKSQQKLRVLFVFRRNRARLLAQGQTTKVPDEFLYGLNHFDAALYDASFIERDDERLTLLGYLWYPIEHLIAWRLQMGFSLPTILQQWRRLKNSEVIISVVDALGLPILMLKALGLLNVPVIYISQGLSDRLHRAPLLSFFYRYWIAQAEVVVVLGEGAALAVRQELKIPAKKIVVVPFGVDETYWRPASAAREKFILSVGSDAGRDYAALCQAVDNQELKIVTRLRVPEARSRETITVRSDFSEDELRSLYQQAAFVVTPLQDIAQPSGQSATLQAMACGAAVIITKTRGLWEPQIMRDGENCLLVAPGDSAALRDAIERLQKDPGLAARLGEAARKTVEEHYTSRHMANRLMAFIPAAIQPANPAQK